MEGVKFEGLQVISAERICKPLSLSGYNLVLLEDLKYQDGWANNFPALYVERSVVNSSLLRGTQECLL